MDRARILVTGASGFIGRPLIKALAADGWPARAAGRAANSAELTATDYVQVGDLSGPVDWARALDGIACVVHAAGIAHAGTGRHPAALYQSVNAEATGRLAQEAARAGVKRFVFLSSIRAQTGPASAKSLTEDDAPQPTDDYGRSKLMAEAAIRASGVAHTILRPVVVYGPGAVSNIAALVKLCALPMPLPLAAFENRRSLLAIDNLIAAIRFALDAPAAINETFVIADPGPLTLAEMAAAIRTGAGRRPALFSVPPAAIAAPLRWFGRDDLWQRFGESLTADPAKLLRAGWQPVTDTRTGLAALARDGARTR
jgi:UDP-glucose 4-epimerase